MGSVLFKQLVLIVIIALALQCSSTALADQPMISTDKPSYNPWETVDISINETSNITAHVIDPWSSLTELILTPSEDGYLTEYSPQQGVVLGTYTILVSGEEVYEISEFDIRTLSISSDIEQYYTIGDIPISGNVVDTATDTPVNASVNITIDGQTINAYAIDGNFSTTYMADSTGQKTVSITAIDDENIIGTSNAGFEVYSSNTGNLTITTSKETYEANQNVEVDVTSELGEPVIWITDPLGNPTYLTVHETQGAYGGKLHLDNQIILGEYWAQAQDANSTEEVKIPFNVIAPSVITFQTPENPTISFSRRLSGHEVGQHKVPPIVNIDIEITAEVASPVSNATLIDHYPADWIIQDSNGGTVDTENHTITWNVGDVVSSVSRSYTIFSPQRTFPPTDYDFATEVVHENGSDISDFWTVRMADLTEESNLRSPTANSGSWSTPTGAYLDGGDSTSISSGTGNHIFSSYGFNIPTGARIDSVRIRTDTWKGNGGSESLILSVSENGGSDWLGTTNSQLLSKSQTEYWIDVTGWTNWNAAKINNDNIQTKVSDDGSVKKTIYLDWIPIEVNYSLETSWSTETLEFEGVKNSGSVTETVDITAIGNNSNVAVEFVSGDSGKFSHNWTTADVNNGESRTIEFTCDDSENGEFSAVFNVTSDGALTTNQINVTATIFSYATLNVTLEQPIDGLVVNPGDSFTINATVTCVGEPGSRAGDIYALARYGNLTANTNISTTYGASPFYIEAAGSVNFTEHVISTNATSAKDVYAIDLDSDGDIDVLSASMDDDKIAWYENNGVGSFTEHIISTNADSAYSVHAIDLDGDNDIDVLSASITDDKVAWYENDGSQSFTEHIISNDPTYSNDACDVYAIDLDGDNDIDVLSGGGGKKIKPLTWYENNGSESFTKHIIDSGLGPVNSVFAIDVDGINGIDVVTANGALRWYKNDGSQSFTGNVVSNNGSMSYAAYAADLDEDNDIDMLGAFTSLLSWHENDGSESFTEHILSYEDTTFYQSVYPIDIDNDNDLDVVGSAYRSISPRGYKIAWYENHGNKTFTEHVIVYNETADIIATRSVFAIDVDGDGDNDVLNALQNENKILWFENTLENNPKVCPVTLNPGDTWNVSWTVNVTGGINPQYEVDVLFYSSYGNSNVADNDTADSTVIIGSAPAQSYMNFSIIKTIELGVSSDNYNVTLNLTSLMDFDNMDVRAYDVIPANFTIANSVPNHNGSQSNIYYWSLDLAAGESKNITYTLIGNGEYSMTDAFTVGVGPI